jgi:hypothetical protein
MVDFLTEPQKTQQAVAKNIRKFLMQLKQESSCTRERCAYMQAVYGIEGLYQLTPIMQVSEEIWEHVQQAATSEQQRFEKEQACHTKTGVSGKAKSLSSKQTVKHGSKSKTKKAKSPSRKKQTTSRKSCEPLG